MFPPVRLQMSSPQVEISLHAHEDAEHNGR